MKAMLLAAGRGQRMGSLTETQPKPLLTIQGKALIEAQVEALARAGVQDIVINTRHLAGQIKAYLGDGARYQVNIVYSDEQDQVLNTGGGIVRALPLLGNKPFIVASSDLWTDFDYSTLPDRPDGLAHSIMVQNPAFHPHGDFAINAHGYLTLEPPKLTYGNIAVIDPVLFANSPAGAFPLVQALLPAIELQQVTGRLFSGQWENVGTKRQLTALNKSASATVAAL